MGCPDWPLCNGQIIPEVGDSAAWLESIHRWWGVLMGFLVLGLVISAFRTQRATRSLVVGSVAALLMVGFQAYLGKVTVEMTNSAEIGHGAPRHGDGAAGHLPVPDRPVALPGASSPRAAHRSACTLLVGFSAVSVFALLLFGTEITCVGVGRTDGCAALIYPDWPLFDGAIVPTFDAERRPWPGSRWPTSRTASWPPSWP